MLNISILGSCVTRDAIEFLENVQIDYYASRTSLISMMSDKTDYNILINENLHGFLYRTLEEDNKKTHFDKFGSTVSDYLIIDFIDERFAILKDINNNYITCSNYVESHTNCLDFYSYKIPKLTMQTLSIWIQSAKKFSKKINNYYKQDRIILHEAYFAGDSHLAKHNNIHLSIMYNFLKVLMPKIQVIKIDDCSLIMNSKHKWGEAPFHYIDSYYEKFSLQLMKICNENITLKKHTLSKV